MQAVAAQADGRVLADIGTDHAHLPIVLCQAGRIGKAIASDIHEGPLDRARANIAAHGLSARIETRLGAGLSTLAAGEADVCVVAGMGGLMVRDMLAADMETATRFDRLLLQPQRDLYEVRRFLTTNGFTIEAEQMLAEDGKFYNILTCCPRIEQETYTETELHFGRCLLRAKDAVLRAWLDIECGRVSGILSGLRGVCGKTLQAVARYETLLRYETVCKEAEAWLQ